MAINAKLTFDEQFNDSLVSTMEMNKQIQSCYEIGNFTVVAFLSTLNYSAQYMQRAKNSLTLLAEQVSKEQKKYVFDLRPVDFFEFKKLREFMKENHKIEKSILSKFYMFLSVVSDIPDKTKKSVYSVLFNKKEKKTLQCNPLLEDFLTEQSIKGIQDLKTPRLLVMYFFKFITKLLGRPESDWIKLEAKDINEHFIRLYLDELVLMKARGKISFGTFKNRVIKTRAFLLCLESKGLVRFNVKQILNFEDDREEIDIKIIDDETIRTIFKLIPLKCKAVLLNLCIFSLFLCTGCRPIEIIRLNLCDFDPSGKTIRYTGKAKKTRTVPITSKLVELIKQYINIRPIPKSPNDEKALFLNVDGRKLSKDSLRTIYKTLLKGEKVKTQFNLRHFRHTFATKLALQGVDPLIISTLLGHASINETIPYYQFGSQQLQKRFDEKFPL